MLIGVLALQGDVREHLHVLRRLGAQTREVRSPKDLEGLSGIVLPGGESTAQAKLLQIFGLFEPLRSSIISGLPVLATCAGLILLAKDVVGLVEGQRTLGVLDVKVERNSYGTQLDSFEASLEFLGGEISAAFIRAPRILESRATTVLSSFDSSPVIVRAGNIFGATCHPEITGELALHRVFLEVCGERVVIRKLCLDTPNGQPPSTKRPQTMPSERNCLPN